VNAPDERIYVVDDDPAVGKSLSRLFRSAGFDVLAFDSPEEFLRQLPREAAGCVVLDLSMPGLDGLGLQRELAARTCGLPVIFLTGYGDVPRSVQAIKNGAMDFLTKPVDGEVLLRAVRRALEVERSTRSSRLDLARFRWRLEALTPREREVLGGILTGRLNKQIGRDLGITEKTVKVHRGRVMEKMGAASLAELVHLADRAGIRPS
jgi:FixJ family two-component response regulator